MLKKSPLAKKSDDKTKQTSGVQTGQQSGFRAAQSLFQDYQLQDKGGYITQEFQDFGYRMTMTLNDPAHKSLYMNLAKRESRILLEQALSFVEDAISARSKAKLFMWKLKQLKGEQKKFRTALETQKLKQK